MSAKPAIKYKAGYKYQLAEDYSVNVGFCPFLSPDETISTNFIRLAGNGDLTIRKGYAWDGASGPAVDTRSFMRGSLVHDALYQLMRMGLLEANYYRDDADLALQRICIVDGMWRVRAWWVYRSVALFAKSAADPSHRKPVLTAP